MHADEPCRGLDRWFEELTNGLLAALLDFDFVSESCLPEQQARIDHDQ